MIKATGIPQLNKMLASRVAGVTHIDFNDPTMGERIKAERVAHWNDRVKGLEDELAVLKEMAKPYSKPYFHTDEARMDKMKQDLNDAEQQRSNAEIENPSIADVRPSTDWRAVWMLRDWACDGVLINVDDDVDVDDSNQPALSRDDGTLLNVAIQGPTPMRNTNWMAANMRSGHEYEPQHVDANIACLDKVFVGLVAVPEYEKDESGEKTLRRCGFQFKCFSGRQMLHSGLAKRAGISGDDLDMSLREMGHGDAPQNGPTDYEFDHMAGAWRVGSVMDNRLTTDVERRVLLNVCVEWWPFSRLLREYVFDDSQMSITDMALKFKMTADLDPVYYRV